MIVDSLKNCALYYSVNPRLERAFDYLKSTDLSALEPGKYEIEGKEIFLNLMDRELKTKETAKIEVHNDYLDVQLVLEGTESFGWSERCNLTQPQSPFNAEKDVQLFDDVPQTYYTLKPGQFTILLPEDGHAPLVGEGRVRKAILKVKM